LVTQVSVDWVEKGAVNFVDVYDDSLTVLASIISLYATAVIRTSFKKSMGL